ncbi:MAG: glycosyltransferase family 4 protein [Elusimicrobia bacterium]|nr:glycosyltransferase family 4 protein [Elusimicrobiota bacterium]
MRISVTCYESLGVAGGSAIQVLRLAEELVRAGHSVTIYAPGITKAPRTSAAVAYMPVLNIPGLRFVSYLLLAPFYLALEFSRWRPDVLLVFEVYFDLSSVLLARLTGTPLHVFVNAIADQELRLSGSRLPLKWALGAVQALLVRSAGKVYTISGEISAWLRRRYSLPESAVVLVRNGVDTRAFAPLDAAECRRKLGLPAAGRYIGFVGRPAPWHGLGSLVAAAPAVLREVPDARFLIVGEGPSLPEVKELVRAQGLSGNFVFAGEAPHAEIPAYIGACDVCVAFYKPVRSYAGDPMKLYEYLACGRAVLAEAVPGYGDLVVEAGAGLQVRSSDPAAAAEALIGLLKDGGLRAGMGINGRKAAVSRYEWAAGIKDMISGLTGGAV